MSNSTCPECGSSMEKGFIPDSAHGPSVHKSKWHRGEPGEMKFLGMPLGMKTDSEAMYDITAYRCTECGLIRLYA